MTFLLGVQDEKQLGICAFLKLACTYNSKIFTSRIMNGIRPFLLGVHGTSFVICHVLE